MDYQINFPHLGIHFDYVIKSIAIGNFTIAIYGITMATALLVGLWLTSLRAKETGQKSENYIDLFILLVIFGFIGARAYYVAFQWDSYKNDLLQILNLRGGGIAIYGGLIAGIITTAVYCRVKHKNIWTILDTVVMGVAAGQIIGRWGNFFNREAFGGYTDGLFAMQLPVSAVRSNEITTEMWNHVVSIDGIKFIQVHPTFLYEGMWNLALLILLFIFRNKVKFRGENFFRYIIGYGIGRFWVESLRTDQLIIPNTSIPVSMVVSAAAAAASAVYIVIVRSRMAKGKPLPFRAAFGSEDNETASDAGQDDAEKPSD
ncbi:MAG: prolipoprotein diacylglyceryl transferase [Lachnospiraceae bacterium]|jgi:phosphatidylglycerol:prolipoprotein diacylglycerol transferase|nr:prolipoprotein diacylglyceryl transferase [Lachnospiraceae bacterium]MCI1726499.1 prolipoprotein diacylglyceryl transferase [Lachnospiraceae bacterium]